LAQALGVCIDTGAATPVGGGSINRCYRLTTGDGTFFAKLGEPQASVVYEAEAAGLEALERAAAVRVPKLVAVGCDDALAYLVLEWIDFGPKTATAESELGRALAAQHRSTATYFGWERDNTIGATEQLNQPGDDWIEFFRDRRLRHQLELASARGLPDQVLSEGRLLLDRMQRLFEDHRPEASLLHGDLWGGNWGVDDTGTPYVFDPAVYFGDREVDLAMTRLFGGYGDAFYRAYAAEWPLAGGWEPRVGLYNLYHLINHFNLFGSGYLGSIYDALDSLKPYLR
jgi:fructosamine-3-kinase